MVRLGDNTLREESRAKEETALGGKGRKRKIAGSGVCLLSSWGSNKSRNRKSQRWDQLPAWTKKRKNQGLSVRNLLPTKTTLDGRRNEDTRKGWKVDRPALSKKKRLWEK